MKRMGLILVTLGILIALVLPAGAMTRSQYSEIRIADVNGESIQDVIVFAYVRAGSDVLEAGRYFADSNGLVRIPHSELTRWADSKETFTNATVNVVSPGRRVETYSFSIEANKGENEVHDIKLTDSDTAQDESSTESRSGSGIFRTVLVWTTPLNQDVKVGELHFVEGVESTFTYGEGTETRITVAKQSSPGSPWTTSGSALTATHASSSFPSTSASQPSEMLGRFMFHREYWELQEMCGDIPDVWHTRDTWQLYVPIRYEGYLQAGAPVPGNNEPPTGSTGPLIFNVPTTQVHYSELTFNVGYKWLGYEFSSTARYYAQATTVMKCVDPDGQYVAFDRDWSGRMWWVTKMQ